MQPIAPRLVLVAVAQEGAILEFGHASPGKQSTYFVYYCKPCWQAICSNRVTPAPPGYSLVTDRLLGAIHGDCPVKPLCFVLMPFGRKPDERGRLIDFDAIYRQVIAPAVTGAEMEVIRADEEQIGGTIHKPMFERLMLCEYAVADITGANPNVFYELGIRHALRPRSTVIVFSAGSTLPFDVALLRGLPYAIGDAGLPTNVDGDRAAIKLRLEAARRDHSDDSPVFQLVEGMPRLEVDHSKTDIFRQRAMYSKEYKDRLATARREGAKAVAAIAADPGLSNLADVESGIVVDLLLSYRAVSAHQEMVDLFERMPAPLQRTRLVREQFAFALNRLCRREEAEKTLRNIIDEFGASSETNALLGRVYKDRWEEASKGGRVIEARGLLKLAIETYLSGFEADWRDAYPGINAVTLMEMQEKPDLRQIEILPIVRYAASQRAKRGGDYWDHATLLELAVLARDQEAAADALAAAFTVVREPWEIETTARNLGLIRAKRDARGEDGTSILELEKQMNDMKLRLEAGRGAEKK